MKTPHTVERGGGKKRQETCIYFFVKKNVLYLDTHTDTQNIFTKEKTKKYTIKTVKTISMLHLKRSLAE